MIGADVMFNGLRRHALSIPAAAVLALVGSHARAQGIATSVDPIALESEFAVNPNFDVASLWRSLKISADLDTVYTKVGVTTPASAKTPFDRCSNECRAQLTQADLDGDGRNEAILAIFQESKLCRLLVFKGIPSPAGSIEWRFLGHADHDALGQYEPEYRVSLLGNSRYFVVVAPVTQGTEMRLRYERWYEVGPGALREVLTLPADGFECRDGRSLCRAFGATAAVSRTSPRGEELVVGFTVRYWGDRFLLDESLSEQIPLFSRSLRAVFNRPIKSTARYELAPLDSDLASWDLDTFRLEGLTCQDFLVANMEGLVRVASDRESAARTWLTRYVGGCSASKERTALSEILAK